MIFYTRSDVEDSWHWHRDCPRFPREEPIVALYAPSGSPTSRALCPECLRLDEEAGHSPNADLGIRHLAGGDDPGLLN